MKWILSATSILLAALVCILLYVKDDQPERRFEDLTIVFLCVGQQDDAQILPIQQGLNDAANDFGCNLKVWWCGWYEETILDEFSKAILYHPDAICVPGFERESGFVSLLDEASEKGILVTTYHTPLPNLQKRYVAAGMGYVGQDQYDAGHKLVKRAAQKFNIQKDDSILIFGNSRKKGYLRLRSQGMQDAVKSLGLQADFIDMLEYWKGIPSQSVSMAFDKYLKGHDRPDFIFFDSGSIEGLVKAFADAAVSPGEIDVACFDSSTVGLQALQENKVQLIYATNGKLQSYLTVLQACLGKRLGLNGMDYILPGEFIDSSNIARLADILQVEVQ